MKPLPAQVNRLLICRNRVARPANADLGSWNSWDMLPVPFNRQEKNDD